MSCQNAAQSDDYLHSWLRQIKNMGKFEVILTNIKKTECVIKTYSVFLIFIKSIKKYIKLEVEKTGGGMVQLTYRKDTGKFIER